MVGSRSRVDIIAGNSNIDNSSKELAMSKYSAGWMEPPAGGPPGPGGIEENGPKTEIDGMENMKMCQDASEQTKPRDAAENATPQVKDDEASSGNSPNSSKSGPSTKSTGGSKSFWEGCSFWICVLVVIAFAYITVMLLWISEGDIFSPIREVWKNKKYNLIRRLGEGYFATVYLAMTMNRQLRAVKVLKIGDKTTEADARREVAYMKKLRHKNVVGYYDSWVESVKKQRIFCIAMEYCRGGTLSAALSEFGPEQLTKMRTGLEEGLSFIHAKGIAHLDIHSKNILVAGDGTLKYGDWGLAKPLNATTQRTDMDGLETVLREIQRQLTTATRKVNTYTRMKEFIEPRIGNALSSVSEMGAGMPKLFM